jgi:endothelin-converting enzyme/putative endopeptidase
MKKKTVPTGLYLALSGLMLLAFAGTAFAQAVNAQSNKAKDGPTMSLPYTPGLDVSAMDLSADPCVDFYQYTCGGWMVNNPIPADQSSWSVYGKLYQDNQRFLWGILQALAKPDTKRTPDQQKIGDYFSACMDVDKIDALGIQPLEPLLAQIQGLNAKSELPGLLGKLHFGGAGSDLFFGLGPNQDFADSTRVITMADAGGLGLPDRDYYTREDDKSKTLQDKYRQHVAAMLKLARIQADPDQAADQIFGFEARLARASLTKVERRDPKSLFHNMDLAGLQALTPAFAWRDYLGALSLQNPGTINVSEPAFYRELNAALEQTDLATIKAYMIWHVVHENAAYLSRDFVDASFDFYSRTLRGVPEQKPRWKKCVALVDGQLGEALGKEFTRRVFPADLKKRTLAMTHQIETAMAAEIRGLDWMSDQTKKRALEKLKAVANKIGYPDKWRDYSRLAITADDFFANVLRANEFDSARQLAKIGRPVERGEWSMTPQTVNAYYDPQMNEINFPAGVLQPPLYDPAMDDAPNYGNTGGTIGHELTHGFDDEGRQFDAKGNLVDWWAQKDEEKFNARAQCIVDQYAEYIVVDDIKINSKLTLGEDIADLGGLILAYAAWKAQTAHQDLKPIQALSPEQRFFVGYAQWACENKRPEQMRLNAATDPHSPGKYRVNGLVANMPQFAKAFMCKKGQPLAPPKVCSVW